MMQQRRLPFTRVVLSTLLVLCFFTSCLFVLFASHLLGQEESNGGGDLSSMTTTTTSSNQNNAIFYNIYIPNKEDNPSLTRSAIRIVKEQMLERKVNQLETTTPVFYTLIGNTNAIAEVQESCEPNCHITQSVEEGSEILTLQKVYDYCIQPQNSHAVITYMHNKGSLHPTPENRRLRTLLTKSIFTTDCQNMNNNDQDNQEQCNVCGARFSPFPHLHYPGNMWTAKCEYVSKLIPPVKFEIEMDNMMEYVMESSDPTIPKPSLEHLKAGYYVGTKRFSSEHWIGSHPYLKPCDVYSGKYLAGYSYLPQPTELTNWKPDIQQAPRFDLGTFQKRSPPSGEWYCGQTRLLEYTLLYGRLPVPSTSFLWSFFNQPFKSCKEPLMNPYNIKADENQEEVGEAVD